MIFMTKEDRFPHVVMFQEIIGNPENYEKTLYHYTSPEGLLGILQKDKIELHFTKYISLNDKKEGMVLGERYIEVCDQLEKDKKIDARLKEHLLSIPHIEFSEVEIKPDIGEQEVDLENMFLCSFSECDDSLPMWNYYVKGGEYEGYCLGFKGLAEKCIIPDTMRYTDLSLCKIQYDEKILYNHILKCVEELKRRILKEEKPMEIVNGIRMYLAKGILLHKQRCFSHEKEIRAIFLAKDEYLDKIDYKTKKGVLVQYIKLEVDKTALKEITIGPLMESELAKKNLEAFLKQYGYNDVEIKVSKAPIRY